jgi:hypothetical protein
MGKWIKSFFSPTKNLNPCCTWIIIWCSFTRFSFIGFYLLFSYKFYVKLICSLLVVILGFWLTQKIYVVEDYQRNISSRAGWFMMFNTTFNNISGISWWSDFLVEGIGVPGENHRPTCLIVYLYYLLEYIPIFI